MPAEEHLGVEFAEHVVGHEHPPLADDGAAVGHGDRRRLVALVEVLLAEVQHLLGRGRRVGERFVERLPAAHVVQRPGQLEPIEIDEMHLAPEQVRHRRIGLRRGQGDPERIAQREPGVLDGVVERRQGGVAFDQCEGGVGAIGVVLGLERQRVEVQMLVLEGVDQLVQLGDPLHGPRHREVLDQVDGVLILVVEGDQLADVRVDELIEQTIGRLQEPQLRVGQHHVVQLSLVVALEQLFPEQRRDLGALEPLVGRHALELELAHRFRFALALGQLGRRSFLVEKGVAVAALRRLGGTRRAGQRKGRGHGKGAHGRQRHAGHGCLG